MQDDGNFVLYNANSRQPYWATNTHRSQGQFTAIIQNDGNFVVYQGNVTGDPGSSGASAIWASGTSWVSEQVASGDRLTTNQWIVNDAALVSANSTYAAYLQDDANLVLCRTTNGSPDLSRPYWSVMAHPDSGQLRGQPSGPPYHALMQPDGNFVLYDGRDPGHCGPPYWATNTSRSQGQFTAIIHNDGNFVVYQGDPSKPGTPAIWATNTVTGQAPQLNIVSGNNQSVPCQIEVDGIWYDTTFQSLEVRLTDSVLNPIAGQQVNWSVNQSNIPSQSETVIDRSALLDPSDPDYTCAYGPSDANGMASMSILVRSPSLPLTKQPFSFTVAASSDGCTVTFNLSTAGTIIGGVSPGPWS
jgi:hypothetical protein